MAELDLRALGEFGFIEAVRRRARVGRGPWVRGIGDDAALLRPRAGFEIAVTTDLLVEQVHFRWSTTDARSLGAKSLAASLSDLGAMGAQPRGCLLSLALPTRSPSARLDGFVRGFLACAAAAGSPLVGGDTSRARRWTIAVTALGEVPRGGALLRSGARPGDRIAVTGELGGSALGLHLLERGGARRRSARPFARRHLHPRPPWAAGARLRRTGWATAAIDVSDGLLQDLGHVLRESGVAAEVHVDRLPLPRGMRALCARLGLDAGELALSGGEDYELLFCVRARAPSAAVFTRRLGCRVTEIGVVCAGRGLALFRDGSRASARKRGFEHFKRL